MPIYWDLSKSHNREMFNLDLDRLVQEGKAPVVQFVQKKRTHAQNNALHLWLSQVADYLNEAGMDARAVLKPTVAINWTPALTKEYLFKPLLGAITGLTSTCDADTKQYNEVVEVMHRHFGEKYGLVLPPFPSHTNVPTEIYEKTDK